MRRQARWPGVVLTVLSMPAPAGAPPAAAAAAPIYFDFQGELVIDRTFGADCQTQVLDKVREIQVFARDTPGGLEGFILDAGMSMSPFRFSGPNLQHLSAQLAFDDSVPHPRYTLRLDGVASQTARAELQAVDPQGDIKGCFADSPAISLKAATADEPKAFDQAATFFRILQQSSAAIPLERRGHFREALTIRREALAAAEAAFGPDDARVALFLSFLGQEQNLVADYAAAEPLDRRALRIYQRVYGADSQNAAGIENNLGEVYRSAARLPEAEALFRHALAVYEKFPGPDSGRAAFMVNQIASILSSTGRFAEAEPLYRRGLAIHEKLFGPDKPVVANDLNNLGRLLVILGRYGEAETLYRRALAIDEMALEMELPAAGAVLNNLGSLLRITGRFADAEPLFRRAVAIDEKALGPDHPRVGEDLNNLGNLLYMTDRLDESAALMRRVVGIQEKVYGVDHPAYAQSLNNLAEVNAKAKRYAEAEPLFRHAIAIDDRLYGPDYFALGIYYKNLGRMLCDAHRPDEALPLLEHGYRIVKVVNAPEQSWRTANALMTCHAATGSQPALAIFYGKDAVNTLQQLRGNVGGADGEAQNQFTDLVAPVYRKLADLLIADGRLPEAQQVLAMLKEQELFDFAKPDQVSDPRKTAASLTASEKSLADLGGRDVVLGQEYGALQEKFQKTHQLSPAEHDRLNELRVAMDAAQAEFEARVAEVSKEARDPEAQKRRRQEITDFSRSFQGTLKSLGHDAVLAQYFLLDDKVEILLTTPNVVLAREVAVKRSDLNEQIRRYRATLGAASQDPLPQAQALYRLLLAPIAGDLRQAGARTLMLSLDDTLRYLPFAALHDGKEYLIEQYAVVMVTEAVRDKLAAAPKPDWSVWGLGVTRGGKDFDPLPYVGVELNGIAGAKGILAGKVLLDSAFTEESLRDGLDQAYPIIHIASHFQFTPGSLDDSFLLLGDGSRLSLGQIRTRLNFNSVELLTLSACETALGDDGVAHHGIEVEGLGAIAQQAGAKAVLATLWPVADGSTALLMRSLYQAHKHDHLDKAESLQRAQLMLLRGTAHADAAEQSNRGLSRMAAATAAAAPATGRFHPDPKAPYAHPYYWAPFILMGNWL